MAKILPILNVAFAAIAMIVSIVVLLQVMGLKSSIETPAEEEMEASDPSMIPLAQLEEYNIEDSFLLSPERIENPDAKINVILSIGFAMDIENEGIDDARLALTSQTTIIRSRIQSVLDSKDVSYFEDDAKKAELNAELLSLVQGLIGNDAVVEVYFVSPIISEK